MSLYNNFEQKAKKSGITSFLTKGAQGIVGSAINKTMNSTLAGPLFDKAAKFGITPDLASFVANEFAGQYVEKKINEADNLLRKQVRSWLSRIGGGGFEGVPEKKRYREFIALQRARKNHFIVQIDSNLSGDFSKKLNLFVTDIDLNPMNISGEKRRIGGAFIDAPTGAEATEIRITTMDDELGTIKKWFERHCAAVVASDGTFGVPASYAVTIKVLHAVVDGEDTTSAFTNRGLYRAATYEVQLSRREQGMQEVNLTFTQIDSFMR
ncbi:hypothetical protein [Acinetobacter variabilis]|uniref:Uncharacterized protein n=1 Tax=Acinetobacter variabilis TaxID=70346 RepID=N8WYJ2_9GAMM|nr:hypothetical protein [Acinetobacter variabilis]ENV00348.1 hypothetical protein F969_00579 [Acinetobacter variabilis]